MSGRGITVDPHHHRTVYFAGNSGIWRSQDAGASWIKVNPTPVLSVTVDPTDSNIVYAGAFFLVARKRNAAAKIGNYESEVLSELADVVAERVDTLWEMGISGADLVIACIGAGLRAFTKYERVEYGNGEEVPSQRFLTEVETVVLEAILKKLSKAVGANGGRYSLVGLDAPTRFYMLWRYTYKSAELDAGEAIIFANGTHVELDGLLR